MSPGDASATKLVAKRTSTVLLVIVALVAAGCSTTKVGRQVRSDTPSMLVVGTFVDDYDISYEISESVWAQGTTRYNVQAWHNGDQFLIAQVDPSHATDGGKWVRIDWMPLRSGDFTWAFCYTVYDATNAAEAASRAPADRSNPRTGCGGYPFSRMKRVNG